MNINNNLKYNNSSMGRMFYGGLMRKGYHKALDAYYDENQHKWLVKNNLGNYEEWGVMPTVATLEGVTTYKGKLVILSTDSHEYKWNGSQWVDLGIIQGNKIGWLTTNNGNAWFECDFDIRLLYIDNNYIRVRQTYNIIRGGDRIWDGGIDTDGGWFSLDCDTVATSVTYYNIGSTTYINKHGITRTYNTTSGWSEIAINSGVATGSNSDGLSFSTNVNVTKTGTHNFSIFGRQPYHSGSYNLFNICIWTAENGTPYRNYYGTIDANNVPCIYEAVTGTYLYNKVSGQTLTFTETGTLPGGIPEEYPSRPSTSFYQAADSFSVINNNWSYNIDATNEIVSNITNATKPYAYNTSDSKWYVKNNLGNYEQWGLMPTVSDLNNVTTYTGKLVILSTDSHEYKWNGTQWVDLGGYVSVVNSLKGLTVNSYWTTDYKWTANTVAEIKFNKDTARTSWTTLFGARVRDDTGSNNGTINVYLNTDDRFWGTYNGLASGMLSNWSIGSEYTVKFGKGKYYINDTLNHTYSSAGFNPINYPIWIGGLNQSGSQADNALEGKIYYFKIWENDTLVRDYRPLANLTFVDLIGGNIATLVGTAQAGSTQVIPEEYPAKPAPTLTYTKSSYNEVLSGSYINGLEISVYNKKYDVSNGTLTERPAIGWLKGLTTSSKWITNYTPNTNTEIEIKMLRETRVSSWTAITCVVSQTQRFNILLNANGNNIGYGCGTQVNDTASGFSPNTVYTLKLNKDHFYVNNLVIDSFNLTITTITNPLSIGGPNGSGIGSNDNCFQGKIYYLKIWENGTLVRDYQPQSDLTFKCSLTGNVATLTGSAEYGTDI